MRRVVERALSRGARSVIFDLRQVSYMDTGALKVPLSAKESHGEPGRRGTSSSRTPSPSG